MPGPLLSTEFNVELGDWWFHSAAPDADLADVVAEYWEVEGRLRPFRERVLPNGHMELMVNLGPVHHLITTDGARLCDHSWLSGLHERAIVIESPEGTHLVSARLHPEAARRIVGRTMRGTGNQVIDLRELLDEEAEVLRARLLGASGPGERFAHLEGLIRDRVRESPPADARVLRAVHEIRGSHGTARIADVGAAAGISRKHLGTLLVEQIGVSPKAYAQIVRFAWVLARIQESESVDWPALAQAAGYADQPHLVRDFARVAQASPTAFLKARTPDGIALLEDR